MLTYVSKPITVRSVTIEKLESSWWLYTIFSIVHNTRQNMCIVGIPNDAFTASIKS